MLKVLSSTLIALLLVSTGALATRAHAQTATGSISGVVTDSTGAVVPNASVSITNKATSSVRALTSNDSGLYNAPGLEAGDYSVRVIMKGFKTVTLDALVQPGSNSAANIVMQPGDVSEIVSVTAATPAMDYEGHAVQGVVEQQAIENIPTNGRSYVELASLQPGVTVTAASQGIMNAPLRITVLGGTGQYPLVTVDGLQINDYLDGSAGGGTAVNFSTEVIQEFQLSSANFDLSTPTTIQGSVNMVTRSGSNALHGSVYMFYRDHNMAAYPGFSRNPAVYYNPHPYFVRKNPGFTLSGPLVKDKLFAFGNYEYTGQASAITVHPTIASMAPNDSIFTAPYRYNYTTVRLDYEPNRLKTNWFLRWTQDRNSGDAPLGTTSYPSGFVDLYNWSEQYALGATTAWTSNIVSELRFGFRDWKNVEAPPPTSLCAPSTTTSTPCLGGPVASAVVDPAYQGVTQNLAINGLPQMSMAGDSTFTAGVSQQAAQNRLARDYEPQANISWQKGSHRLKFGYDLDLVNIQWKDGVCLVGCLTVESVETTTATLGASAIGNFFPAGDGLPATVTSNQDLLKLPIIYPSGGFAGGTFVGNEQIPGPYEYNKQRKEIRQRWYMEDYWKVRPNLTVNYGLGYVFESRLFPIDMPQPALEGPIFGLAPGTRAPATPNEKIKFQPGFGFTWSPGKSGKTVIRGGGGLYWDSSNFSTKSHALANIGPIGNGPLVAPASLFTNLFGDPVSGGPTPIDPTRIWVPAGTTGASTTTCQKAQNGSNYCVLPVGAPLPAQTFSTLTLGQYEQIYNREFANINSLFNPANPITSGPYQYSNVDLIKANTTSFNSKYPLPRSYQTSIGIQRQVTRDLTVTADWVQRIVNQASLSLSLDLNHYTEYDPNHPGVQLPVIPKCNNSNDGGSVFTLGAQCSTGAMTTAVAGGNARYEGLLVSANKRMAQRYSFALSYAYQNLITETVINLNNYKQGYGPSVGHHNLNLSGVGQLPWGFGLSLNSSIISRAPVSVTCGVDLTGTGATSASPCPGLPTRGWPTNEQVTTAANNFNSKLAGTTAPSNQKIQAVAVPSSGFALGKSQFTQDARLTKTFRYDRYSLALYGEVFNLFNIANLTGYSSALTASSGPTFGKPTGRAGQVFLSSGPRAEQIGARISF
jgi:hypothetical protein